MVSCIPNGLVVFWHHALTLQYIVCDGSKRFVVPGAPAPVKITRK
jgi:hypothetical protein